MNKTALYFFFQFLKMSKISSALLSAALSISGIAMAEAIKPNFASAQACSTFTRTNITAFRDGGGFCEGTPSVYGIKVFKMGFCTSNPFTTAGVAVDYSSCTISFEDSTGYDTSFAAGSTVALPAGSSSLPAVGSYDYAVIELDKTFDIAAEIAFDDGTTYYSTSSWTTGGSPGQTTGSAETFPAEMASFNPNTTCQAISDPVIQDAATLKGYLINSSSELIADDTGVTNCSGVSKIVGVAQLNTAVTITSSTTGLIADFTVSDNGSSVFCSETGDGSVGGCRNIMFDSGPFKVEFTVVE